MNLNGNQVIAIIIAVLGVLIGSAAQLTDLFGPNVAKTAISVATIGNSVLASVLAVLSGQGSIIKSVMAMPGVENITVNRQANSTLSAIAIDPANEKIEPIAADKATVSATAKGTT